MSESPPRSWLERLLAAEAEQAIPDEPDLWPDVSQRLRERAREARPSLTANGAVNARDLGTLRSERQSLPIAARVRQRSGELIGAAITFGLAALVIAIFALIAGWPVERGGRTGFGGYPPDQVISDGSTPTANESVLSDGQSPITIATPHRDDSKLTATKSVPAAGPDCSFDLDVSLETGTDSVEINVWARSNWACADTGTLRLTVIDASGERAAISGNQLTLPLTAEGRERRAEATVVWSNWCGERGRFRIETSFGDEQRMHKLPEAPRCVDQERPSVLRINATDAASSTPEKPATWGTPIP